MTPALTGAEPAVRWRPVERLVSEQLEQHDSIQTV